MRRPTTLERRQTALYDTLATTDNTYEGRDALVELGFTHLAMEPGKMKQAAREIWAGMHGRSGMENLGIVARVATYISAGARDPETLEYADALRRDRAYNASARSFNDRDEI